MKYYIDNLGNVFVYLLDGSQDELIGDKKAMTNEEVVAHFNPIPTTEQITAQKIQAARIYLNSTDFKFYGDYEPKDGEDMETIKDKRKKSREFIRANKELL